MKAEWEQLRSKDCTDSFTADAVESLFPRMCCDKQKKHDEWKPGLFKEEIRCSERLCLCSKTYCSYDKTSNKLNLTQQRRLQYANTWAERWWSSWKVSQSSWRESEYNIYKQMFLKNYHTVATSEHNKRGLLYFYFERIVEDDGIHRYPLI